MQLEPVDSSAISKVGYMSNGSTLAIEFPRGVIYFYVGVEKSLYHDFLDAESKGQFYNQNIKNQYPREKADPTN